MAYLKERLLIRYCSRVYFNQDVQDADDAIDSILNPGLNWTFIIEQAQEQDISPLLYYRLSGYKENLPQDILSELKDNFQKTKNTNYQLYEELKKILVCFKENNIKSILLKGIDLAKRVYPDIALRPMTDIDLLIKKHDLPKIERALMPLDYLIYPKYRNILNKPNSPYLNTVVCKKLTSPFISLHLHWHILNHTFYPIYGYIADLNIDKIWQKAQLTKIDEVEALIMAPDHLLLYLAEHHLKHFFGRLILLADIDALLKCYNKSLDWQSVSRDALEFNFSRPLFYSLYFVSEILGAQIPKDLLLKIKPRRINRFEKRFIDSVLKGRPSKNHCYFAFLAMNKGITRKIRFVFRTVFPDPDYKFQLQDIYGIKSNLRYTLNHLTRIFRYTFSLLSKSLL